MTNNLNSINSKSELINNIFGFNPKEITSCNSNIAKSYAPTNFALIKYWGKGNEELMIPNTDSISIALGNSCGTTTEISINDRDIFILDGKEYDCDSKEYKNTFKFVNLFKNEKIYLKINTKNDLALASGLATSASGFAALILTLNELFNWKLNDKKLSMLARLGSVSASRSIYKNGIVRLTKGKNSLYTSSHKLPYKLDNLYVGILSFSETSKKVSSRDGMSITIENSLLYKYGWKKQVNHDIKDLLFSLKNNDWQLFKTTVQNNALSMHGTAISAGVIYWSSETVNAIKYILELQESGVDICFTEDAGEHLKILSKDKDIISKHFPTAKIIKIF